MSGVQFQAHLEDKAKWVHAQQQQQNGWIEDILKNH